MDAIAVNLSTGAVSEYTTFPFDSITRYHGGNVTGLYQFGGDLNHLTPITATVETGKLDWSATLKKAMQTIFYGLRSSGECSALVNGEGTTYSYPITVKSKGVSRAVPGRGIRENYLSFGLTNPDGQAFTITSIEIEIGQSTTRRT